MNSIIATLVRKLFVLRGLERVGEARPEEGGHLSSRPGEESELILLLRRVLWVNFTRFVALSDQYDAFAIAYSSFLYTIQKYNDFRDVKNGTQSYTRVI